MSAELVREAASCAHLHIDYDPILHRDGSKSERWTCSACGHEFVNRASLDSLEAELAAARQLAIDTQNKLQAAERDRDEWREVAKAGAATERKLAEQRDEARATLRDHVGWLATLASERGDA